jgi:hypothetical protein
MANNPAKRQREIDDMMDLLASDDPAERREAAYWLGEAAVADAVPKLVDLYENDDNRSVRRAAGYALGMFRAVDRAMKRGKEKQVVKLLKQVEEKGKLGRRANKGGLIRQILGLVVALALMGAAYQFLPNDIIRTVQTSLARVGLFEVTPVTPRATLLSDIRQTFIALRDNTTTLQGEFQKALGGGTLDCTAYFNVVEPVQLFPEDAGGYPDIAQIVDRLNVAHANYATAYARFDSACIGTEPLSAEQVGPVYASLVSTIQTLPDLQTALDAAETGQEVILPTIAPTAAPPTEILPTELPTNTPPPTTEINIADPRAHLATLYGIIENVTADRGAGSLLEQFWEDVQGSGASSACGAAHPPVPESYVLPEADAQASPDLAEAVRMINVGLEGLRVGWTDFEFACNSNALAARSSQELAEIRAALASFQAAELLLNNVRDDI